MYVKTSVFFCVLASASESPFHVGLSLGAVASFSFKEVFDLSRFFLDRRFQQNSGGFLLEPMRALLEIQGALKECAQTFRSTLVFLGVCF